MSEGAVRIADRARHQAPEPFGGACTVVGPDRFDAVLFDRDGVLTTAARMHAAAWNGRRRVNGAGLRVRRI